MILNLSNNFIHTYNKYVSQLFPKFNEIQSEEESETKFMCISVALRIAAKLSKKYGYSKESFMDAANGNYDLECQQEIKSVELKSTDNKQYLN